MSGSGQQNSLASNSAPHTNGFLRFSRKKHSFQHIFVSKKDIPVPVVVQFISGPIHFVVLFLMLVIFFNVFTPVTLSNKLSLNAFFDSSYCVKSRVSHLLRLVYPLPNEKSINCPSVLLLLFQY